MKTSGTKYLVHKRTNPGGMAGMIRIRIFILTLAILFTAPVLASGTAPSSDPYAKARAREIRMGREAAIEVEKECKLVKDPAVVERVEVIGKAIAAVANVEVVDATYGSANVYQFDYKFKVIEDKTVNAFSLPGGYIYIHTGLLDYAQSEHELAGVLAHEIAHASHHHMVYLLKEQSKLDGKMALLLLAGVLSRIDTDDLSNLLIGAQFLRIAKTNGYGRKAEGDADAAAVTYMTKSGFNPVGMLTFLERLARDYNSRPEVDMGIMQTHPMPKDRCRDVLARVKTMGIPVNRRAVTDALVAQIKLTTVNDQPIAEIVLGKDLLFKPAPIDGMLTSRQRAEYIVGRINRFLDTEPDMREIALSPDGTTVLGHGEPIIVVSEKDSLLCNGSACKVASDAAELIKRAVWREMIDRMY